MIKNRKQFAYLINQFWAYNVNQCSFHNAILFDHDGNSF